jgi:glycosyltransferase involved in cell wall biosynthesis
MRILFVNHTSAASGAEYALLRLVSGVRRKHHVAVACPASGPLADMLDDAAVQHVPIPAFEASLRLDPVHTPLNFGRLAAGGVALARAARRFDADLLHANTPRAGLMGALANRLGGPPLVVRAHEHIPLDSVVGRGVRSVLGRSANAILTVSEEVERRINQGLDRPVATHVYNSFDRERFDPDRVEASRVREELGIAPGARLLAQVAQITPWKAQDTSIRALAQLHREGVDAHLLIVGNVAFSGRGVRYDNPAYLRELHGLVTDLSLQDKVHFLGQRRDVPGILRAIDLSLLPSWDEPFANVMLESMAMGTPLLVSSVGGGPELVEDGVTGRVLPPRRPEVWASAARDLLRDSQQLEHMGARARAATANFSDEVHARDMLDVYEYVLAQPKPDPAAVVAAVPRRRDGSASPARRSSRFTRDRDTHARAGDAPLAGAGHPSR